jgi:type I restriction enzyme S subunit
MATRFEQSQSASEDMPSEHGEHCTTSASLDWKAGPLSDLCRLQRGFDITEKAARSGDVPVYSSSGLSYYHNEHRVQPPGVVTGRKGILGKVFFVDRPFWPHDTTLWVIDFRGNCPAYVYWFLVSLRLERFDAASAVPTLNRNNIAEIPIRIPPLSEQRAIAETLSNVDGLIVALENLIAKKRGIKQGAMQQLLVGKTRLPGFSGKWDHAPLSALCTMETGRRPKGGVTEEGDVPSLGGENVHNANGLRLDVIKRVPNAFFASMRCGILQELDIIINKDGANTGKVALYAGSGLTRACVNEHLFLLRARPGVDVRFLYAALCLESVRNEIDKHIASSAQPGLNRRFFKVVEIQVPEIREQQAIAAVLSDIDAEITALERRRDKTKAIKQGMMQSLLTGRVRLVKGEAKA